eukprot:jgi/Botrbrau1/12040/Bobra.0293s0016.1
MLILTIVVIVLFLLLIAAWESRIHLIWWLELVINTLNGARRAGQTNFYLKEVYAPVTKEVHEQDLPVEGALPEDVDGVFLRVGPNPFYPPMGDYHMFDGDGMIHAVRMRGGKVAYSNHWVQTERLRQEQSAGHPLFLKYGDLQGKRALIALAFDWVKARLGVLDFTHGRGTANTALAYHHNRLLALHEGDMPYQVRVFNDGALETIGRVAFGGTVPSPFTAHPKIHPVTGELVGFGWSTTPPFLHYFVLDPEGRCTASFPIPLPAPVMMHDFAITQDYVIFMDFPLLFNPQAALKEGKDPFMFDKTRSTRFGVMRRDAKSGKELQWYEMESMFAFHVANAWQEGPIIKLYAAISDEKQLSMMKKEFWKTPSGHPFITEICINTNTGETSRRRICDTVCEFPTIPSSLTGQPLRYVYVAESGRPDGSEDTYFVGTTKIDLHARAPSKAVAGQIRYGGWQVGGEPIFVHRKNAAGEDDGYLLTFVTDVKTGESALHIYDAAKMVEKPVCRVPLPHRIPYGFHALHMSDTQLHMQLPLHKQLESLANVRVKMTSGCIAPVQVGFAEEAWRPRKR